MKALAYLFLIAAVAGIIAAEPSIAVFCAILGVGFLLLSGNNSIIEFHYCLLANILSA